MSNSSESKSSSDVDFDERKLVGSSESKEGLTPKKAAKADAKDGTTDSKDAGDDGADIVSKVIAFFFDDDEFAQTFERFAETHCHEFDLDTEEMKLKYTDIYNQFLELFEVKLEGTSKPIAIASLLARNESACGPAHILSLLCHPFACLDDSVHCLARIDGEGFLPSGALRVRERPPVEHRAVLGDPGGHRGL